MIVQLFRTIISDAPLVAVNHGGKSWADPDQINRLLADQGDMLPEGWENTPYGHPIIPVPIPQPTPLGDWWFNWYPDGARWGYNSEAEADSYGGASRIAKEHVWTDADGNDHAEVIRL